MSSMFPIRTQSSLSAPDGAHVIAVDDESAGEVINALSSQTARDILVRVYDDPCTPSDLAAGDRDIAAEYPLSSR